MMKKTSELPTLILEPQEDNPLARIETKFANAILPEITEGKESKGGLNKAPTTKRPEPPKGQGRKPFREYFMECNPMETLPKETVLTAFQGPIDVTPFKCVVDDGQCSSGRCPKSKEQRIDPYIKDWKERQLKREEATNHEKCPDCGKHTVVAKMQGGVECINPLCKYWFCY